MGRCDDYMKKPIHPDKKCCFNCAREDTNCEVWHNCGEDCPGWDSKVATNADRIRAMSDRELAAFLAGKFTDHETMKAVQKGEMLGATYVSEMAHTWYAAWMQWLRQPAEVENGV